MMSECSENFQASGSQKTEETKEQQENAIDAHNTILESGSMCYYNMRHLAKGATVHREGRH